MSSILKTTLGVAGGIQLFKTLYDISSVINECKQIYDAKINQPNTDKSTISIIENPELKQDAVNALVNLGYKTRDSQNRVNKAINEGGCTTIQEVLKYVLTNNSNK